MQHRPALGGAYSLLIQARVLDSCSYLVSECLNQLSVARLVGVQSAAVQCDVANHLATRDQWHAHPAARVAGISPAVKARIRLRIGQNQWLAMSADFGKERITAVGDRKLFARFFLNAAAGLQD